MAWLLANKVLLPGLTTLERAIARVRSRANERLWQRLTQQVSLEQRAKLEALLVVPEADRQSLFDRLRDGPVLQSPAELGRAVERLEQVQGIAAGLPRLDRLPVSRLTTLARFANAAKAQAIERLPDERRIATLLAFVRTLEASANDDVLDLFDVVVTGMFSDAKAAGQKDRLGSIRDLDAAAMKLKQACVVLLDDTTSNAGVRPAVFSLISRAELAEAIAQIDNLARPHDDQYFKELRAQHNRLRFMPSLLRATPFAAAPAGKPIMEAIEYVRTVLGEKRRPGPPPMAFVPANWLPQVRDDSGAVDMTGYRLCLLDRMRAAIRRRDLFVGTSFRHSDPRKGLLDGAAWEAARPAVCRTLGVSSQANEELQRLSQRLDEAYRHTAGNLPQNVSVRIEEANGDANLVLSPLDKLEEPESLVALRRAVDARMPRVDLPELVLEIQARTGFADAFRHASEARARADDIATSVCAVLVSEACNTGLEPMILTDVPALRRARLGWVKQNYIRADTLTAANAKLVAAQNSIGLVQAWGGLLPTYVARPSSAKMALGTSRISCATSCKLIFVLNIIVGTSRHRQSTTPRHTTPPIHAGDIADSHLAGCPCARRRVGIGDRSRAGLIGASQKRCKYPCGQHRLCPLGNPFRSASMAEVAAQLSKRDNQIIDQVESPTARRKSPRRTKLP